jgi:uncharacterized membrane protein
MKYQIDTNVEKLVRESSIEKGDIDAILNSRSISYDEFTQVYDSYNNEKKKQKQISCKMYYMGKMTPIITAYTKRQHQADSSNEKVESGSGKTKEYLQLMQRLRREQEEREYMNLLNKGNTAQSMNKEAGGIGKYSFLDEEGSVKRGAASEVKEVKHQITTIFNIFITVISAGYAVWYWSGSSMGLVDVEQYGLRILMSLFVGILVLVAEVVVFGGYLRKIDEAKERERNTVEEKVVIDTVVIKSGKSVKKERKRNAKA